MTTRQKIALAAVAVLVLAVMAAGAATRPWLETETDDSPTDEALATVVTLAVEPRAFIEIDRTFTGALEARQSSWLSFELPGRVAELLVDEGDRVEAGATLARQNSERLRASIQETQAALAAASALLKELENGTRAEVLAAAKAEVAQRTAEYQNRKADLARSSRLVVSNSVSRANHDAATFAEQAAAAQLEAARHRLAELKAGPRAEQIEAQRAEQSRLEATLAGLRVDLEKQQLTAPFAGVVTQRLMDTGEVAAAGQRVFRIIDARWEARVGAPVAFASGWAPGDEVQALSSSGPWKAVVAAVLPEVDPRTRTQTVILRPADPKHPCGVAGQIVEIQGRRRVAMDGFWAPRTALTRGSRGLWAVYQVVAEEDAHRLVKCEVEVLHTDGRRAYVRGPLNRGDLLVADGLHKLAPGAEVRPPVIGEAPDVVRR